MLLSDNFNPVFQMSKMQCREFYVTNKWGLMS